MKKKLYGVAVILAFILICATCGGLTNDIIDLAQGAWQIGWGLALLGWGWYGLYLEETRAARKK